MDDGNSNGIINGKLQHLIQDPKNLMTKTLQAIVDHPYAVPFLNVPTPDENQLYHDIIAKPIDLSMMMYEKKYNMTEGWDRRFERDWKLLVSNCKKFNKEGSTIVMHCLELDKLFKQLVKEQREKLILHNIENSMTPILKKPVVTPQFRKVDAVDAAVCNVHTPKYNRKSHLLATVKIYTPEVVQRTRVDQPSTPSSDFKFVNEIVQIHSDLEKKERKLRYKKPPPVNEDSYKSKVTFHSQVQGNYQNMIQRLSHFREIYEKHKSEFVTLKRPRKASNGVRKRRKLSQTSHTFLSAALTLLWEEKRPLSSDYIAETVMNRGWITTAGKTPQFTVASRLYVLIKDSRDAPIDKAGPGIFQWKSSHKIEEFVNPALLQT